MIYPVYPIIRRNQPKSGNHVCTRNMSAVTRCNTVADPHRSTTGPGAFLLKAQKPAMCFPLAYSQVASDALRIGTELGDSIG